MSAKRQASVQISKEQPEDNGEEEEQELTNDFQRADGDTLAKRRIVKVRRPARAEGTGAASSAFASAFSATQTGLTGADAPKAPSAASEIIASADTSSSVCTSEPGREASSSGASGEVNADGAKDAAAPPVQPAASSTSDAKGPADVASSTVDAKASADTAKPSGFVFGSSLAGGFSFSFANPPGGPTSGGFSWSAPSSTSFNFSASSAADTSGSKKVDDEDGDDGGEANPEDETKHDFTVKNPPKMADKPQETGEEDESVSFQLRRAKLFHIEKESKQFREAGVGPLRINVHKTTGRSRVIMRVEGSGRLILNAPIFDKMFIDKVTDKQVRLQTVVAADDGVTLQPATFLIRVASKTDAEDLVAKICEIKDKDKSE